MGSCKTVAVYTLGCKANQYESEAITEALERAGILSVHTFADACVINTCTVTAEADRKCRQTIRRAIRENPGAGIFVTGCMAQVNADAIAKIKGVNFICGNRQKMDIVSAVLEYLEGERAFGQPNLAVSSLTDAAFEPMTIERSERTRAYIKVEDGCDSQCSYCIIPKARGPIRSKKPEDVLAEARGLIAQGYKELVLTGIEVSAYGRDLPNYRLEDLVCDLDGIEGIERIRFPSTDPACMREAFIDRISACRHLAPHFHLSLQSGCDRTLRAMKRRYNTAMVRESVAHARERIPDVQFTADIIVGFPGETDADYCETCEFLSEIGLLSAHVFAYSRRPGTPAAAMPEQIPEEIKRQRSERLIRQIAAGKDAILREYAATHRTATVLFETQLHGRAIGRLGNYMEIEVECPDETDLRGRMLEVEILPCQYQSETIDKLCGKIL